MDFSQNQLVYVLFAQKSLAYSAKRFTV